MKLIGGKRSLDQPFEGPYEVLERISDTVFKIRVNDVPMTVSTERLKPAFIEGLPQQIPNDLTNPADPVTQPLDTYAQPTSVPLFIAQPTSPTSSTTPILQPSQTETKKKTQLLVPLARPTLKSRPGAPPRTYADAKSKKVRFAT